MKSIIFTLVLAISVFSSVPATAEGESPAVREGVASLLGTGMREMGAQLSGGSVPGLVHLFNNWEKVENPCRNTVALLNAFFRDSNGKSGPEGIEFSNLMINTFGLPAANAAQYAAQGEIISSQFYGKNHLKRKLLDLKRKVILYCNPPNPKPAVSVPPPTTGVTAGGGSGSGYQPPPKPPVKPKPPVRPPAPPKPVAPPLPPKPDWSVDNPCPECQPIADDLADEKVKLKALEKDRAEENRKLGDNKTEQDKITTEIATIEAVMDAQKGTGGSGYDPATGVTISSVNVGGGKVVVTTTDRNGNQIGEPRERETSSSRRAKKKIKKLEKQLKELKGEEKKIREKIKDLDKKIDASKEKIKALQQALEDCIKEKCKKGGDPKNALMMPGGGTPTGTGGKTACTPTLKHEAIAIGPKDEIGTGFNKVAEDFARKLAGGGGLFSGGGFGSSESEESSAKPQTAKDPIKSKFKQKLEIPGTDIKVEVGAIFDKDGKLLVSSEIDKAPGKGTFHDVTLHNIDCQQLRPMKYYVYDLYLKWNISVQYTTTTTTNYYQDGALVRTDTSVEQSDWMDYASGTEHLGSGEIGYGVGIKDDFPGIWRLSGFNRATSGNRAIGTKFDIGYKDMSNNPFVLSLKYTQPNEDPVTAAPLNLLACPQEDGKIELFDVKKFLSMKRHFDGGGVSIDPPTLDLRDHNTPNQMVKPKGGMIAYPTRVTSTLANGGGSGAYLNQIKIMCPSFEVPKAYLAEMEDFNRKASQPRNEDGTLRDPNQAGDDFMKAFINAFGASGPDGSKNIDRNIHEQYDEDFDDW